MLVVALVVTFVATVVQGTIGIGLGMLSVPVLTLLDPALTPVPQIIVVLPLTAVMLGVEREAIDWRSVGRVSAARVPGIGVGLALLATFDERTLDGVIGLIVLIAVVVIASGITVHRNHLSEIVAGVTSGATATVSSIGGPPVALLYREDRGPAFRSNLAAIFAIGGLMIVIARFATGTANGNDLVIAAWLAAPVALGYLVSRRLHGWADAGAIRTAVLAVCSFAALALMAQSLL